MRSVTKIVIGLWLFIAIIVLGNALFRAPGSEEVELSPGLPDASHPADSAEPSRLLIPKLDIDANVQRLGITRSGNMAAPDNFTDVSWYKYGTVPGHEGSAVMAGHEDNALSLDGVFKHLEDLELGDEIFVEDENGERLRFLVVESAVYPYDDAPLKRIFNRSDKARLNLITCAGDWLPEAKTNDKRLVIYAELAPK